MNSKYKSEDNEAYIPVAHLMKKERRKQDTVDMKYQVLTGK